MAPILSLVIETFVEHVHYFVEIRGASKKSVSQAARRTRSLSGMDIDEERGDLTYCM